MLKKVFIALITIVVCVILGGVVINILFPNFMTTMVDAVEDQIFRATSLSFDFNGNGTGGSANDTYSGAESEDDNTGSGTNSDVVTGVD